MLAQSTDSGQLIAATAIKLFHAMKLQVQDLRGVGIQMQLLDGHARQDSAGSRTRSIKEMLLERGLSAKTGNRGLCEVCMFVFIVNFVCQEYKFSCSSLLQILLTCSRKILPQPQPHHHIFCPLLSQSQGQAETCRHAGKLQNALEIFST